MSTPPAAKTRSFSSSQFNDWAIISLASRLNFDVWTPVIEFVVWVFKNPKKTKNKIKLNHACVPKRNFFVSVFGANYNPFA